MTDFAGVAVRTAIDIAINEDAAADAGGQGHIEQFLVSGTGSVCVFSEGADVRIISLRPGRIRGMNFLFRGRKLPVDDTVARARPEEYGALLLPGGFVNPDLLRQSKHALEFVRQFDALERPIASRAAPTTIWIDLSVKDLILTASVRDDGRGMIGGLTSPGLGIRGMHERANLLGGTLRISSELGKGTQTVLEMPRSEPVRATAPFVIAHAETA